jgi:hypothetical protein
MKRYSQVEIRIRRRNMAIIREALMIVFGFMGGVIVYEIVRRLKRSKTNDKR